MRNQKQLMKKETQERIQRTIEMDKKINEWQESVRNASLAAEMVHSRYFDSLLLVASFVEASSVKCVFPNEQERKMKKEADSILSEVRKKRADATRLLELVKAIVTLRSLRKQSTEFKG